MDRQLPDGTFLTGDAGHSRQTPSGIWVTEAASEPVMSEKFWLPHKEVWTKQPQELVGIDWSNPLTKQLRVASSGRFLYDFAAKTTISKTASTGATIVPTKYGNAFYGWVNNSFTFPLYTLPAPSAGKVTVLAFGTAPSVGALSNIMVAQAGGTNKYKLGVDAAGKLYAYVQGATPSTATGDAVISGEYHAFGMRWNGTNVYAYLDGKVPSQTNVAVTTPNTSAPTTFSLLSTNNGEQWYSTAELFLAWGRELTDEEIRRLSLNPWQIFEPKTRRIWVPNAGIPANNGRWLSKKESWTKQPNVPCRVRPEYAKYFPLVVQVLPGAVINAVTGRVLAWCNTKWSVGGVSIDQRRVTLSTSIFGSGFTGNSFTAVYNTVYRSAFTNAYNLNGSPLSNYLNAIGRHSNGTSEYESINGTSIAYPNSTMPTKPGTRGSIVDGASGKIFIDGIRGATTSSITPKTASGPPSTIWLGDADGTWDSDLYGAAFAGSAVPEELVLKLTNNFWDIFEPQERRIWVPTKPTPRVKGHWL